MRDFAFRGISWEWDFGDDAMSVAMQRHTFVPQCYLVWHKRFKDDRESVESDPRSRRPATSLIRYTHTHVRGTRRSRELEKFGSEC